MSHKNIDIYYIGYITMKDSNYVEINSVNPLYLIIGKTDGYREEKNGDKYSNLVSTDKKEEVLTKQTKLWNEIKYLIKTIKGCEAGEYGKDYMKSKFSSDDNLPLNKILKLHNLTVIVRSVFQEDNKFYQQVVLD